MPCTFAKCMVVGRTVDESGPVRAHFPTSSLVQTTRTDATQPQRARQPAVSCTNKVQHFQLSFALLTSPESSRVCQCSSSPVAIGTNKRRCHTNATANTRVFQVTPDEPNTHRVSPRTRGPSTAAQDLRRRQPSRGRKIGTRRQTKNKHQTVFRTRSDRIYSLVNSYLGRELCRTVRLAAPLERQTPATPRRPDASTEVLAPTPIACVHARFTTPTTTTTTQRHCRVPRAQKTVCSTARSAETLSWFAGQGIATTVLLRGTREVASRCCAAAVAAVASSR